MKLYLTHYGRLALKMVPLLRLPQIWPKTVSVKLSINKYMRIDCSPTGLMYVNGWLSGINAEAFTIEEASKAADVHSMEIVGIVEYREL